MPISENSSAKVSSTSLVIVGAGPYGLSLAAHLNAKQIPFRIFGKAMATWREHMPENMLLKSEGFASSLSSPIINSRLEHFCANTGSDYQPTGMPIPLANFVDYADWFQQQFVPNLESVDVIAILKQNGAFKIVLSDNRTVFAQRVVMATGITWFNKMPDVFADFPPSLVSHSFQHRDARRFAGRRVVVVGGGSSAVDTASLFSEATAKVQLLVRQPQITFHNPPRHRSWASRIRNPQTVIGPGLRAKFFTSAPLLFRHLPAAKKYKIGHSFPPPAPGWFMKEKISGAFSLISRHEIRHARSTGTEVELTISDVLTGETSSIATDHVVSATGYTVNLKSVPILSHDLLEQIAHYRNAPILSDKFECSVRNLYFIGPAAAPTFGPLMRFMVGAEWAVPRIVRHLANDMKRRDISQP